MIPLRESQWWIAEPAGGGRPRWLCAACGKQYIHTIKASKDLVHGQDLLFNYVVFLKYQLHNGVRTLCAMAQATHEMLQNQINTHKLVLANSKRPLHKGAQMSIMDLMTVRNYMFVAAMAEFPKTNRRIAHPYHVGVGECLRITCDGITSLSQDKLGAEMNFMDMNQAFRNGMFWGQTEDL